MIPPANQFVLVRLRGWSGIFRGDDTSLAAVMLRSSRGRLLAKFAVRDLLVNKGLQLEDYSIRFGEWPDYTRELSLLQENLQLMLSKAARGEPIESQTANRLGKRPRQRLNFGLHSG